MADLDASLFYKQLKTKFDAILKRKDVKKNVDLFNAIEKYWSTIDLKIIYRSRGPEKLP